MTRPLRVLILLMLGSLALSQSAARLAESPGIDFYQFWGVPVALRLTDHALGAPYRNGQRYVEVLREYTGRLNQPKLRAVNTIRSGPDFAGSPLLYAAFAPVSSDYTFALRVFQVLQIVSFLGALMLLGYLYRIDPFHQGCLALLCILAYQPLLSDVRVANLGCFQLVALAALLGLAHALPRAPSFARRAALGAVLLTALALFILCKPNVALIGMLLAAHLAVRHGARLFAVSAVPAAAAAALGVVVPCLYFGSWTVWRDWYAFVYGSNAHMLVRRVSDGNYSTALFLSTWLGPDVYVVGLALMGLLVVTLVAAIARGHGPRITAASAVKGTALAVVRRLCEDPHLAVAVGIVLTIATAPLYWFHYYVLSLIPSLWLLTARPASKYPAALAMTSVAMNSGIAALVLWWLGWSDALPPIIALSWLPLWWALLITARSPAADDLPAPRVVGEPRRASLRSVGGPPSRQRKR